MMRIGRGGIRLVLGVLLLLGWVGVAGCGSAQPAGSSADSGGSGSNQAAALNVFAAASLTAAFQDIGKRFEELHPGTRVHFNFGGSPTLLTQIAQGAPADVFASADMANMEKAKSKGLVQGDKIFAKNSLVLITPKSNPAGIHQYQDLTKAKRVVLGVKDLPAGSYGRQSLQKADKVYGPGFSSAVLGHVVSEETDVKQIVSKIALGEGDAAFVYATDVDGSAGSKVQIIPVPNPVNVTATYPMAVVTRSAHPDLAGEFVNFVLSKEGQASLQNHHFLPAS
ncbi:molybdate ABC transporter substrate-binding protein [Kyrpidia spormannii]|uniref:Molybdate ABC transporter substrate-binding protein n=3 Tax=Alicyclobacillaceae TaxID=186823 RepID=A0ACA8Z8G0_9BACL|nr:molybdate ABC transporter substrate-binding protein [Kyrpidia spormannii]CAB3392170.1 Molybdate ABC transporter substrate-binding protein [Kyrpidia spormannii]CAB3393092.1 Molybdate ABC transporter substrate-binding protein [Kyrpidia spormannii]